MNAPATPDATRWAHVFLVVFVAALAACQIGKVAPALPVIRSDLGISMVDGGWIASLYPGTAVVLGLIGGALADRYGHRNALVAGLVLLALGGAAGSLTGSLGPLLVTRVVEGVGFVLIAVSGPGLVMAASAPRDRGLAMGVWGLFMPIGLTTMLLLSPVVLAAWGWRPLWLVNVALAGGAILLLLRSRMGRQWVPVDPGRLWRDLAATVRRPAPWVLSMAFGLFSTQFSAVMAWLPTFLIETQGRSTAAAGSMAAFIAVLHAPGALLGGWLVGRGVPRWAVIGSGAAVMGLSGLAAFTLGLPPLAAYGAVITFSLPAGLLPTAILTAAPAMAPSLAQVGAFNGILIHGANVGTLLGPPAFAAVVSHLGGWPAAGIYLLCVAAACMAVALGIRALERQGR